MKVKRIGITKILIRIWLFSANNIKSSETFSKQRTQLIIAAHNCHNNYLTNLNSKLTQQQSTDRKSPQGPYD